MHRLIQSSLDGKLVEVPSPEPSGLRHGRGRPAAEPARTACCAEGPSAAPHGAKAMPTVDEERAMSDDISMLEVQHALRRCALACVQRCAQSALTGAATAAGDVCEQDGRGVARVHAPADEPAGEPAAVL